jgi:hypothetical protein
VGQPLQLQLQSQLAALAWGLWHLEAVLQQLMLTQRALTEARPERRLPG